MTLGSKASRGQTGRKTEKAKAPSAKSAPPPPKKPVGKEPSKLNTDKLSSKMTPVKTAPSAASKPGVKPVRKSFTIITKKPEPPKKSEPKGPIKLRTEVSGSKKPPVEMKTAKSMEGTKQKYSVMTAQELDAVKAAAAKIAAAAGLQPVKPGKKLIGLDIPEEERLTKSPLPKKELMQFREILLAKRHELVGDVKSMETEALLGGGGSLSHLPQHMADQGTDTYDQSLNLDLAASQRGIVREIDMALERINNNTFGICELTGKPIDKERLMNTPWARYSIEAARQIERVGFPQS
ncbi:MAG TPA: TraR/DksA C4-type zinc finger protein [Phycisphaerales bacterium]|nr:TraR/DksA C4-type zinc finger protein [Phycisphaerales bacterium]